MSSAVTSTEHLPTLEDRPGAYVLIFDGHCRFCVANVRRLYKMDQGKVAYVSLHDSIVSERWPELSHEQLMSQMYLIDDRGQKHGGAAAFRFLTRKLKALWWLAPLMHIPGSLPLWQFLYRQIARIRYRFGRTEHCDGTCSLHFNRPK